MIKTVVGSFDSLTEATNVAAALRAAGFLQSDINIVANNAQREGMRDSTSDKDVKTDHTSNAAKGAVAGGALGGAAGLAVSLMGLAVPGIGPILAAGPIATMLAGAGAGAVAGGLIGGLTELGVSPTHAGYYAEAVRRGGALVTLRADESRVDEAESIMRDHGAFDIEDRAAEWRRTGWEAYDPDAAPFTYDEIERDRSAYRNADQAARDNARSRS
jgi:hypothetical protein